MELKSSITIFIPLLRLSTLSWSASFFSFPRHVLLEAWIYIFKLSEKLLRKRKVFFRFCHPTSNDGNAQKGLNGGWGGLLTFLFFKREKGKTWGNVWHVTCTSIVTSMKWNKISEIIIQLKLCGTFSF